MGDLGHELVENLGREQRFEPPFVAGGKRGQDDFERTARAVEKFDLVERRIGDLEPGHARTLVRCVGRPAAGSGYGRPDPSALRGARGSGRVRHGSEKATRSAASSAGRSPL